MNAHTVRMIREKETANKIRFKEVTDTAPVIDTLYLPKSVVGDEDTIVVTIMPVPPAPRPPAPKKAKRR
jgi:hypothetical protein